MFIINKAIQFPIYTREKNKKERGGTTNPDGGTELEKIGLREKNLASVDTKLADLRLRKLNLFPSLPFQ